VVIICPSTLTYARQRPRPITASHSSQYDMLAIISSRYQYGPFVFFCCRSYVKLLDYWRAEKNFLYFRRPPWGLRPEARGICHMCHVVNPALELSEVSVSASAMQPLHSYVVVQSKAVTFRAEQISTDWLYTGWQWRNFLTYLCQLIVAAIL